MPCMVDYDSLKPYVWEYYKEEEKCIHTNGRLENRLVYTGVHLHLIYVYTYENPLFNGGLYLPSLNNFYPTSS